ncbi:hypothetical protein JRQ81_013513 [Phrynocephalus forsythii]|uniref:F-box/LRR-repeat protein 7 n=1 Tax=Phrynocephalus forsythii TaxID=171643 RepID=A0A9Q0XZZ0_9SAUR|nr:hypothetical protein JRQ81_013513 [Phrynocephalus forsythii]
MEHEASIKDELTCRKCLGHPHVRNNLHKGAGLPEIWKLEDVASWAELFLDQSPTRDNIQEMGKSTLVYDSEKEVLQKIQGKDAVDETTNYFGSKALHSTVLGSFVAVENSLEDAERYNPGALLNNNKLSLHPRSLDHTQTIKPEREGEDIRIFSIIEGEFKEDVYVYGSTKKSSFHNLPTECQEDYSCIPTLDLQENDIYFWTPVNDSLDEELLCVKTSSLKPATGWNQESRSSSDGANLFKTENLKLFSPSVLGGRYTCTGRSDSCERWNPGMENLLEIKENKCKCFTGSSKLQGSSRINNITKHINKEPANRTIPFTFMAEVKKEVSRDENLDFQPLKEAVNQRNESRVGTLGIDKSFERSKCTGKDQTNSTYDRGDFNRGQKKMELRIRVKDPTMRCNSFHRNCSPNHSENTADQIASNCLNSPYENANPDNDSHCDLDTGPLSDRSIAINTNLIPTCVENGMKENFPEKLIKSVADFESSSKEFFNTSVNVDGQKQIQSDQSQPDYSVLAKYYFYLDYLNNLKRLQFEDGNRLISCQQHCGFLKEKSMSIFGNYKRESLLYEPQAKEHRNNDFATQEITCDKDKRTEVLEQHRCPEEQKAKNQFALSSPKQLPKLASSANMQLRKPCIIKDKKASETRKTGANMAGPKRHWERASIAWSSYTHGEMKPRSQYVQTPVLGNQSRSKVKYHFLSHPTSDLSRVSQVCHRFYQLARDETFWKDIRLTDCHCLNDNWLVPLGNHHPQRFTLDHCHDEAQKITDVGLRQFFQHCGGSLTELSIKSCSGPGFRGDNVLLHASTFCSNLTTIDVSWTGATDAGLNALVKETRRLQSFSANGCQFTDDSVVALAEKHGKSLQKLEIFGCHPITAKCLTSVAVKCPHLKVLNIGGIHKINEDCLVKIVTSMRRLTSLNCMGLSMVTDSVIHFIVKKLPELECLVLSSCSQVTDIALMEISTYLPTIRHLDINGCEEVTDVGVQALAGSCSKLSYIDLSSTATSKRGVCSLANFCFRALECVKLSFCKNISPDAVVKLCKNCKKLKILHLYGCSFLPDLESIKMINKHIKVFHDISVPTAKF